MTSQAKTETYSLRLNGRHVRQATRVIFADGSKVSFVDKMPARSAISQAIALKAKGYSE